VLEGGGKKFLSGLSDILKGTVEDGSISIHHEEMKLKDSRRRITFFIETRKFRELQG
jgi:hypothetical protein